MSKYYFEKPKKKKKTIHSRAATQRSVKKLTDDEFMLRLLNNGGHMRIERTPGTTGLTDPYKLAQLRRLCKEGKIRLARVDVQPEFFGQDFVEKNPSVQTYSESFYRGAKSLPEISYYEVTAINVDPYKGLKTQIMIKPGVREMLLSCPRKTLDEAKIVAPDSRRYLGHAASGYRITLTKTQSSGLYYWPNMFILNTNLEDVDTYIG